MALENEHQKLDYKETFGENTLKTLSSFANTEGGMVIIGVRDDKTLKGINYSNDKIAEITEKIVSKLGIHPMLTVEKESGKDVLKISVQKSRVPVSLNGKYYKRVGNTTREMQSEELRAFFLKDSNWDALTGDYSYDEIDAETVKLFLAMAKEAGRIKGFGSKEGYKDVLERLKLVDKGKLTNAAIILFGKDPQKHFLNATVRILRLKDEITLIGDKTIDGNLFSQAYEAEEAIKSFINVRYEVKDQLQRETIWDYPLDAIREMLLNALIHRDYFKHNVQTQIKIFDASLWCHNMGCLPPDIKVEQLKTVHRSIPRNPLIMDIFYRAGLVEEYGSGTQRILHSFKKAYLPEPEYKEEFGGFSVYFKKTIYTEETLKQSGLNPRQIKALKHLQEKKTITNKEYQEINTTNNVTAFRDLDVLQKKGYIEKQGSGRNVYYQLIITFTT